MRKRLPGIAVATGCIALVNSGYLWAFDSPTIFYMVNVLLHLVVGAAAVAALIWWMVASKVSSIAIRMIGLLAVAGAGLGYALIKHNTSANHDLYLAHVIVATGAAALFAIWIAARYGSAWFDRRASLLVLTSSAALFLLPGATWLQARYFPDPRLHIENSIVVPTSMREEGGGDKSPFWPSATQTNLKATVPSNFFTDSEQCGSCHKEIYEQWKSSMHHVASFNNQFYRKSIEYMQDVQGGTKQSQWCAGCHDHAVIFSGKWKKPMKEQIDTREAQTGLGCISCHAISHVSGTTGNGSFVMEYNALHDIAASREPAIQWLDRFLTFTDPSPHRKTFMKPFMRENGAEFCASCHKVHLDQPVNNYRWIRGFNDYDNWQASGFGRGARSFYYPKEGAQCAGCHMPMFESKDPAAKNGFAHNHRFPGANTAVPFVNGDKAQLQAELDFLQSKFISVDIFGASPVDDDKREVKMVRRAQGPELMSTFAVGEEAESNTPAFIREVGKLAAPLDRTPTKFTPGSTVRVDVVVRTRKIGHFFPGGTVDAFDVWLELEGKDETGKHVFWSGKTLEDGKGPVEPGAHFYKSYMLDAEGNPINKRNAWQARSVLYVRLIPPGAADTVHYRVQIPKDVKGNITLTAKLNYRKFSHYYTQFSYAGKPKPGQDASLASINHDGREFSFDPANIPGNVSGNLKGAIPDLPIVTVAKSEALLKIGTNRPEDAWKPVVLKKDRERWNDWGIGLLLQGDLKGAEYAFQRTIEAEPGYADGHLNVARALIQEGETDRAKPYLEQALAINPKLERIHYFKALALKADGDYEGALKSLQVVLATKPLDRVVLNQAGRMYFLKRDYPAAIEMFQRALKVDTEDLQAHYNLMLAYRGMGDRDKAAREEILFRRFKTDESAQSITAKRRLVSPEDNNERQPIHDHESVAFNGSARSVSGLAKPSSKIARTHGASAVGGMR